MRHRLLAAGLLILCSGIAVPAAAAARKEPQALEELEAWASGPARWLLRPAELRELRRIEAPAEAANFVARFWARRDPHPSDEANAFRDTFFQRVQDADILYPEEGVRGSMTDRGRALVLLGSPGSLQITSAESLQWSPRRDRKAKVVVRDLPMEVWIYRVRDLPRVMAEALSDLGEREEIRLTFLLERGRTRLSRGEEFLELAARVALARPHVP